MVIERTEQGLLIRATDVVNLPAVQKLIDYINLLEIAAQKRGTEEEAAAMADEVDKRWWAENKHRFIK